MIAFVVIIIFLTIIVIIILIINIRRFRLKIPRNSLILSFPLITLFKTVLLISFDLTGISHIMVSSFVLEALIPFASSLFLSSTFELLDSSEAVVTSLKMILVISISFTSSFKFLPLSSVFTVISYNCVTLI